MDNKDSDTHQEKPGANGHKALIKSAQVSRSQSTNYSGTGPPRANRQSCAGPYAMQN